MELESEINNSSIILETTTNFRVEKEICSSLSVHYKRGAPFIAGRSQDDNHALAVSQSVNREHRVRLNGGERVCKRESIHVDLREARRQSEAQLELSIDCTRQKQFFDVA